MTSADRRPLVLHVVFRFDVGGLENGVVNLINHLPEDEFRHAVVAMTECSPSFCKRVTRRDVEFYSLRKPPGQGWRIFPRIWRLFRRLRPAIVHTRNLAALEMQLPARAAQVPVRVHGEHGWDVTDPDGRSRKYRLVRRAYTPFVTHYVALSRDLEHYLTHAVGIAPRRVTCIRNGVDSSRFHPAAGETSERRERDRLGGKIVVGTVGRLQEIKGHSVLIEAVARLIEAEPARRGRLRVPIVGDGPLRAKLSQQVVAAGLEDVIELVGQRDDINEVMQGFDVFALPSLAEGISNTVLEAMACGLPVVATAVGGNAELVIEGETGTLVAPGQPTALAAGIASYLDAPALVREHGCNARQAIEARFSLAGMIEQYRLLYESALAEYVSNGTETAA